MDYYWELILKDGDVIEVPPAAETVIKKRMANKDAINLKTRSIPYSEIKEFRRTAKPFGLPLLDAAAQAFNEPIIFDIETPYGYTEQVMEGRWVKKQVTSREYINHYSKVPAYHKLGDVSGTVEVAFMLPVHEVDLNLVGYCNDDEVARLTRG